ncbi:MAG: UDP-4-amino-4,6-dideoxy-N-acetyl-beta-L-altrosamine transaminase [Deltaproteobacteria bacterium CG_4_10_14_0_2_um_filter_43_8]|nr:MAG: UDP-4-amino-4,6-dideoxy-N-acetyl-beta-L-altrosamine transaminase [Deltaproteobacteria bacterium CG11_big_fil_rev_8_21_14_0_20_42_23]PJA18394.1 MAG: UDP-4-amino-4,6-dideoxy-N-acetyl-beta-L-altrosamine transaminase [Deltaproteobacteria bacterium CG_4_10_14_0_2_um_filter_43_8]PJC64553.1 MAG: UDP-4-amino-4,6-dideoxy-N-acetyl-beta-L-altrosamine transaminase [Deltaproteobacteria bacterium CG_4_9_14_0_2_um_filter_42_21]
MIPYGRQDITQIDVDAVVKILRSDFLTQGPAIPVFEKAISEKVGVKHAVAVNSATSALHIACLALGLGEGDRLWTVPNTFVASANCGRYCGAEVDFIDIDPLTWNMSVPKLQEKLVQAKKEKKLPTVVVPVHFSGQPTDQEAIWELSHEFGFRVLEDASHSIGASRNGELVGSCRWSDITVFSFHPVKIITTGEGGMSLTNDEELAERMNMLRTHGITRESNRFLQADRGSWYYEQQMLGFNYRMTDIQAALGRCQLERLDDYVKRRTFLAHRYNHILENFPLQLPNVKPENQSAHHLYVVRLKEKAISKSHLQVFEEMRKSGIGVNLHYIPVHLQPYYRELGFSHGQYPEAEKHGATAITLPLYPTMTEQQQNQVISALEKIL